MKNKPPTKEQLENQPKGPFPPPPPVKGHLAGKAHLHSCVTEAAIHRRQTTQDDRNKREKIPQVKRAVRWADPPAEEPRNQTRRIGHRRSGPPTDQFWGSDRELKPAILIITIGIALLIAAILLSGCSQQATDYPWIGNPLPKPPTFRHIGPGQWLVSDGKGTATMTANE